MSKDRFEARVAIGGAGYFMQEGKPKEGKTALYVGPERCSDEIQRHLTLVFDVETGNIDNIHLTGMKGQERWKKWQIILNDVRSKVAAWIRGNSQPVTSPDLRNLSKNYYCVSAWRIMTGFRLMERLTTTAAWMFLGPLAGLRLLRVITEEDRKKGRLRIVGSVNVTRLVTVLRRFRPLKGIVEVVLPILVRKAGPRVLALCLTKLERMSKGDASLLIPKTAGLRAVVVVKWDKLLQVEAGKVIEQVTSLYDYMELREIIPDVSKMSSQLDLPWVFEVRGRELEVR